MSTEVKRFIRKVESGLYYGQSGWTADPAQATSFSSFSAAVQTFLAERPVDAELVLQFGDEPSALYDIRLPLTKIPPRNNTAASNRQW